MNETTAAGPPSIPPFKLYVPGEGHPEWSRLFAEAAGLAARVLKNTGPFTLRDRLARSRKRTGALFKTLANLARNRRIAKSGSENFVPLFFIWTMTNACNFICSYCSNHRGGKYPELFKQGLRENLSTEQGKRLITIMKAATAIYFCGGEPTIRKDLPELLAHAHKEGMFNFINTNGALIGSLLEKPAYKDFLRQMDVIIVSLDGLNVKELARMYNANEGAAETVVRNIVALWMLNKIFPFKLVVNVVICKENITEARAVLDFCNDLGITFSPVSANIDNHPDHVLLADPGYLALVELILERARQGYPMIASAAMLDRLLHARFKDCYPAVFNHIDHDGKAFWPCKSYPGAVKVDVLACKDARELHAMGDELVRVTGFHGEGPGKCGGSCAWMQDCVTEIYGRAAIQGIFKSGVLKEIRGLMK
ncbi:MAG: radical SAM protein [Candidatus Sigynarchaeota archaeon]